MRHKKIGRAKRIAAVIMSAALMITGLPQWNTATTVKASEITQAQTEESIDNESDIKTQDEEILDEETSDTNTSEYEAKSETDETSKSEIESESDLKSETETDTEIVSETETETESETETKTEKQESDSKNDKSSNNISVHSAIQYTATDYPTKKEDGSYSIDSKEQFIGFLADTSTYQGEKLVLNCDIDMEGALTEFNAAFTGNFDGNGHTISNITVTDGLFNNVRSDAVVKNLHISGVSVTGEEFNAGIVTADNRGTISNISIIGNISVPSVMENFGLVAGKNYKNSTISNCIYYGDITSASDAESELAIGGISSDNAGTIESCYAVGKITASISNIGAISATNSGTIKNSASYMYFNDSSEIGGIVAEDKNTGKIDNENLEEGKYPVIYELNGGNAPYYYTLTDNINIEELTNPTKNSADFVGWYSDSSLENKYTGGSVNSPVILYAKWDAYTMAQKLEITTSIINIAKSKTYDIEVIRTPEGSKMPEITWSSNNESVATVDKDGKVTAVGNGVAKITGTVEDTSIETLLELNVTVSDAAINFKNADTGEIIDSLSIAVGEDNAVNIAIQLDEETAKNADSIQWTSSNNNYVTCEGNGASFTGGKAKVTGKKSTSESVRINAVVKDKSGARLVTGSLLVEVIPQATSVQIMIGSENATDKYAFYDINTNRFISIGNSLDGSSADNTLLDSPVADVKASIQPSTASQNVKWSTNKEAVIKIDEDTGAIEEANTAGKAEITATAKDGSDKSGTVNIVSRIMISGIEFKAQTVDKSAQAPVDDYGRVIITSGNSIRLTPEYTPVDATLQSISVTPKESKSIDIVEDTEKGGYIVTAKDVTDDAVVKITGTAKDGSHVEGVINIIVKPKVTKVKIYKDNKQQGSIIGINPEFDSTTFTLTAKTEPENASQLVYWKSSNSSVASVEDNKDGSCVVTVKKTGSADITATAADGSNVYAKTTINVAITGSKIVITGSNNVVKGGTITLKAEVYPKSALNKNVTWSTQMSDYVDVNPTTGAVTGKKVGAAYIEATAADGSGTSEGYWVDVTEPIDTLDIIQYDGNSNDDDDVVLSGKTVGIDPDIEGTEPTKKLAVKVTPKNACSTVTWKSSNEKVATVEDGVITAVSRGTAVITATSTDGSNKSAKVNITVTTLTKSVKITGEHYVGKGKSIQLNATVGELDATNKNVVWTSEYPAVASVDSNGKVTAVGSTGSTTITAEAADGSGAKDEYKIYVLGVPDTVTIKSDDGALNIDKDFKAEYDMSKGETIKLTANFSGGTQEKEFSKGATWTTSDKTIATVEADSDKTKNATVTFLKAGSVTITATAADGTTQKGTVTVTVQNANPKVTITGPKQVASGKKITLSTGSTEVTWKSSDDTIATVNDKGQVTAKKTTTAKTVTITATAVAGVKNPKFDTYTVTVAPAVTKVDIKVDGNTVTKVGIDIINGYNGSPLDLDADVTGIVDNSSQNDDEYVTWKSSNTKIATVDEDGKVTPLKAGTVKITATATDGSTKKSTVTVTIGKQATSITPQNSEVYVAYKKSVQLAVDFKPTSVTNKTVTWTSSNPTVVAVNKKGVVTAKKDLSGDEPVTITATATDGSGLYCKFKVYVTSPATKLAIKKAGEEPSTSVGIDLDTDEGKISLDTVITDKNLNELKGQSVTWKTSNKAYATVDEDGVVTGLKTGKVTITATTTDGTKKSGKVTLYIGKLVTQLNISDASADEDGTYYFSVKKGKTEDISSYITVIPITATYQTLSYATDDKKIATVNNKGKITGKNQGETEITVKTTDGSNISKTIKVRVY